MGDILDALGIHYEDMPQEEKKFSSVLERVSAQMTSDRMPYAFFVKKDTLGDYEPKTAPASNYPLKRIDAIKIISAIVGHNAFVVATTGKPSRELFTVSDRPENFYMQGSMGHAASIGLGVALNRPDQKVVILDGDGAVLMHMGILSSIGHYRPENLYHIVLDNESYETTGDQDTTSATTDLIAIAKAAGYKNVAQATAEADLKTKLTKMLKAKGPAFLRVKINRTPTPNILRITTKHTSPQIADTFKSTLTSK